MGATVKKELILEGLDCANCAAKIEQEVKILQGVAEASMNFVTKTLTIEAINTENVDNVLELTNKIVKRHEPDVRVVEKHKINAEDSGYTGIPKSETARFATGAALFLTALIFRFPFWVEFLVFFASYILVGGEVVLKAFRNILKGQVFDENFLMSIATIGAFAIKEFPEGAAVMIFYQVGEFFQEAAVNRSRKSISALMDIRPDYANLKVGEDIKRVSPDDVKVGDMIVIRPGEKIPLDGRVVEGRSMLDTSALTGEAVPRDVEEGNEVLSGSINRNGLLVVEVTKGFGESTVSKILDLVQNAGSKKAPTENFITKFARYYTPAVVFSALALAVVPPLVVPGAAFSDWLERALIFLVVSCPCALVISIPLSFFGGIGGASQKGILVKGSNYLEALNDVDTVVFDKTGTLTKGVFKVTRINSLDNAVGEEKLLEYAAYAESFSNHPIAVSILKAFGKELDKGGIESCEEIPGHGIKARADGKEILAGNEKLMEREGIRYSAADEVGTVVYMALEGRYSGYIVISDEVKEDSKAAIEGLRAIGVGKLVMLTGDSKAAGEKIGSLLGLDEVHAELLPGQKVERLEMLANKRETKGRLVFVGDGINDAPVLTRADVGIAMGGLGSDAAIEAADVVIMTDEPLRLVSAIKIAKRTRKIVWQNIIFALGVKALVLALGAMGIATMWEAVFADVGVALIAVVNAMRVMKMDERI